MSGHRMITILPSRTTPPPNRRFSRRQVTRRPFVIPNWDSPISRRTARRTEEEGSGGETGAAGDAASAHLPPAPATPDVGDSLPGHESDGGELDKPGLESESEEKKEENADNDARTEKDASSRAHLEAIQEEEVLSVPEQSRTGRIRTGGKGQGSGPARKCQMPEWPPQEEGEKAVTRARGSGVGSEGRKSRQATPPPEGNTTGRTASSFKSRIPVKHKGHGQVSKEGAVDVSPGRGLRSKARSVEIGIESELGRGQEHVPQSSKAGSSQETPPSRAVDASPSSSVELHTDSDVVEERGNHLQSSGMTSSQKRQSASSVETATPSSMEIYTESEEVTGQGNLSQSEKMASSAEERLSRTARARGAGAEQGGTASRRTRGKTNSQAGTMLPEQQGPPPTLWQKDAEIPLVEPSDPKTRSSARKKQLGGKVDAKDKASLQSSQPAGSVQTGDSARQGSAGPGLRKRRHQEPLSSIVERASSHSKASPLMRSSDRSQVEAEADGNEVAPSKSLAAAPVRSSPRKKATPPRLAGEAGRGDASMTVEASAAGRAAASSNRKRKPPATAVEKNGLEAPPSKMSASQAQRAAAETPVEEQAKASGEDDNLAADMADSESSDVPSKRTPDGNSDDVPETRQVRPDTSKSLEEKGTSRSSIKVQASAAAEGPTTDRNVARPGSGRRQQSPVDSRAGLRQSGLDPDPGRLNKKARPKSTQVPQRRSPRRTSPRRAEPSPGQRRAGREISLIPALHGSFWEGGRRAGGATESSSGPSYEHIFTSPPPSFLMAEASARKTKGRGRKCAAEPGPPSKDAAERGPPSKDAAERGPPSKAAKERVTRVTRPGRKVELWSQSGVDRKASDVLDLDIDLEIINDLEDSLRFQELRL